MHVPSALYNQRAREFFTESIVDMKLVALYNVVKDETFLVELIEKQLTLDALKTVAQHRGIKILPFYFTSSKLDFKMRLLDWSSETKN